jgi:threonine/homoserine/homoserine lactone efflux protein
MNYQLFTAFLLITLILVLTPGPIVTLVIATGATRGARAGLLTVAGSTVGNALLVSSIALGLSLVIEHAAIIFEWLRWVGAAYLIWLGIQAWRHAGDAATAVEPRGHVYFRRGFLAAI